MHHRIAPGGVHQLAPAQPVQQFVAVGGTQDRVQRVAMVLLDVAGGDDQEMQIVIAEHGDGTRAEVFHETQYGERLRAAVHEVADHPQAVACWFEVELVEQPPQRRITTLDVADRVRRHQRVLSSAACSSLVVGAQADKKSADTSALFSWMRA